MNREGLSLVVLAALTLGCPDDSGEAMDASTGSSDPSSSSEGEATSSSTGATSSVDASTGADASSSGDGPVEGCPLEGGIQLQVGAADVTPETVDLGAGSFEWSLVATPGATLPAFGPGDEVVVSVVFDGVVSASRDGRQFTVAVIADGGGSTRASATPETVTTSIGGLEPGPWSPSLSTNAGGEPIRLALGGITINPDAGESLSCFSVRAQIPAQANSVEDSSLVDVVAGPELVVSEVRLTMSGDGDAEPFGLTLE